MKNRFFSLENVHNYLIMNGFSKYLNSPYDNNVAALYQKCYKDQYGKKYFIDAKVYDFSFTDKILENYTIEFSGQYYQRDTHNAVNFTFIDWELPEIEEWLDKLFATRILEHYEKWDD